ncbi:hypothetical protein D2E26_0996 [Bifidobacterium dolichotidis]|uniref:Uncharacterized protein n=1 Tax=Bifidobacterium dolichotidis TaxID=2306976 RepID=A0A430FQ16_9BIFI|nr:hypothetical protein [Bifidobacterium dolichotidis]RSX54942.1 hypothetical protein D2E26_0996 [Bifidobacterium dolichotidis]
MTQSTQGSKQQSSVPKLRIAVACVGFIIVLSLIFAFLWPGWAVKPAPEPLAQPTEAASAVPSIKSKELPSNASRLLQSMPDHVSDMARIDFKETDAWKDAKPLEAYMVTYSKTEKPTASNSVQVTVAQWSSDADAEREYSQLKGNIEGDEVISGNIKVAGSTTGAYLMKSTGKQDDADATAIWRNKTVVFEATGPQNLVRIMVQLFPI